MFSLETRKQALGHLFDNPAKFTETKKTTCMRGILKGTKSPGVGIQEITFDHFAESVVVKLPALGPWALLIVLMAHMARCSYSRGKPSGVGRGFGFVAYREWPNRTPTCRVIWRSSWLAVCIASGAVVNLPTCYAPPTVKF